jgi:hypothetical protein
MLDPSHAGGWDGGHPSAMIAGTTPSKRIAWQTQRAVSPRSTGKAGAWRQTALAGRRWPSKAKGGSGLSRPVPRHAVGSLWTMGGGARCESKETLQRE